MLLLEVYSLQNLYLGFYFNGAIRNAKGEIFLGTDAGMMAVKGISRSVHQTAIMTISLQPLIFHGMMLLPLTACV